jgi:hypothetical protein
MGAMFKLPGMVAYAAPDKQASANAVATTAATKPPSFDTDLTPEQIKQFTLWKAKNAPNDSGEDYDLRGLFLSGQGTDARGHATDQFKKPNHPTFSVESKYNGTGGQTGGKWVEKDGKTYFYASPTNLKYHSAKELQDYFKKTEPGVILVLPGKK